jgi:hypothetical protein
MKSAAKAVKSSLKKSLRNEKSYRGPSINHSRDDGNASAATKGNYHSYHSHNSSSTTTLGQQWLSSSTPNDSWDNNGTSHRSSISTTARRVGQDIASAASPSPEYWSARRDSFVTAAAAAAASAASATSSTVPSSGGYGAATSIGRHGSIRSANTSSRINENRVAEAGGANSSGGRLGSGGTEGFAATLKKAARRRSSYVSFADTDIDTEAQGDANG